MEFNLNGFSAKNIKQDRLSKVSTVAEFEKPPKEALLKILQTDTEQISLWQNKLYAENRQSLLIILQGMDSAGKDGTIKHIMGGVNPQGVLVYSFKHPSELELEHDFLWRHYTKLPQKGMITIFNRSHYENVLISKVHPEIVLAEKLPGIDNINKINNHFWKMRYKQINEFEEIITRNGTQVLKFFLHISKAEQRRRFLKRIENKEKNWKFSSADIQERGYWGEYEKAYEAALKNTATKIAPWYIIPSDDKWFAHLILGKIILEKLKSMDPSFPKTDVKEIGLMKKAKSKLLNEK